MASRKLNPTIIANNDIVSKLPVLPAKASQEANTQITKTALTKIQRLMEIGVLFETPSKVPEMSKERFKYLPQLIRRIIRSSYGFLTVLHQKLNSNKHDAFYLLVQELAESVDRNSKPKAKKREKQ